MSIRVQGVSKEFASPGRAAVRVVDDVSLEVATGELVTLLGPSGCGKTTTLRMIAGFEAPAAGQIFIAGRDVTAVPAHERDAPMVFQSYALFPQMSVRDNALFGLSTRGVRAGAALERVQTLAA